MTTILNNNNKSTDTDVCALSEAETKQYLTPFAFKMDNSLFGLPLASPAKRAIALLIDFSLIALLSDTSGVFLALAIAITLYYMGNKNNPQNVRKPKGHRRRATMRFIAAFMLFIILLDTLPPLLSYFNNESTKTTVKELDSSFTLTESVVLTAIAMSAMQTIDDSACNELPCWQKELAPVVKNIAEISDDVDSKITEKQLNEVLLSIAAETGLPSIEQGQLVVSMQHSYEKELFRLKSNKDETQVDLTDGVIDKIEIQLGSTITENENENEKENSSKKPVYSIVEWLKGIINDLGLGFGWATFYFTGLIALNNGQTIGKKLFGLKVMQLDGTPLSLWDSFGRYGGYGAGLATGLLGFLQVYWDPNKQAIHDKISATVVIDLRKPRLSNKLKNQTPAVEE